MTLQHGIRQGNRSRLAPVLILTALQEEAEALNQVLQTAGFRRTRGDRFDNFQYSLFYSTDEGFDDLLCAVVTPPTMGKLDAAVTATIACIKLEPAFVILVGIAGGFRSSGVGNKISLGDVLIADTLVDVDMRKLYADSTIHEIRPRIFKTSSDIISIAKTVREGNWYTLGIPPGKRRLPKPSVHFGPVISADAVSNDAAGIISRVAKLAYGEIYMSDTGASIPPIGIEMEGAGVALAVDRCAPRIGFVMIRAVSDYAERSKSLDERTGRELAKFNAAVFSVQMMRNADFYSMIRLNKTSKFGLY